MQRAFGFFMMVLVCSTCVSQRYATTKDNCPTFRDGKFSFATYMFCDSTIYAKNFSDNVGGSQSELVVGKWKLINDSTIEILSRRKKWLADITYFNIITISDHVQLLVPDKSLRQFDEDLKEKIKHSIRNTPSWPNEEDKFLIQADSVRLYKQLLQENNRNILGPYLSKLELDIFWGAGRF